MNKIITAVLIGAFLISSVLYAQAAESDSVTSATTTKTTESIKIEVGSKAVLPINVAAPAPAQKTTIKPNSPVKQVVKAKVASPPVVKAKIAAPAVAKPIVVTTQSSVIEKPLLNKVKTEEKSYEDGTYRGIFFDTNELQVNVDLKLMDNKVTEIKFRALNYKAKDYKNEKEDQKIMDVTKQYTTLINHLKEKDIRTSVKELYTPGEIVKDTTIDGLSGATLRSGKVISAINDALNRGVYSYSK